MSPRAVGGVGKGEGKERLSAYLFKYLNNLFSQYV
jgi:hypothetical protein